MGRLKSESIGIMTKHILQGFIKYLVNINDRTKIRNISVSNQDNDYQIRLEYTNGTATTFYLHILFSTTGKFKGFNKQRLYSCASMSYIALANPNNCSSLILTRNGYIDDRVHIFKTIEILQGIEHYTTINLVEQNNIAYIDNRKWGGLVREVL